LSAALVCSACGNRLAASSPATQCGCGGLLDVVQVPRQRGTALRKVFDARLAAQGSGVWRFRELLMPGSFEPVSHPEGNTHQYRREALSRYAGVADLALKHEGENPTGSFKDRGMVMAVAKALEEGAKSVICASTGNTSASAAAYAAAAGLECVVVLPAGKIALGKLLQALVFGARVVSVSGNFDDALRVVRALSEQDEHPITLVNSVNPYRLEGQKTAAFEVCDDLGRAPDILAIPVGNAGNISAYWKGFREYRDAGRIASTPRMWGFQAAGAAPLVLGHPVDAPETIATAIRIGNPASWDLAIAARDDSRGRIDAVTDDQILHAYRELTRLEGVFCEPSSAASVAGVIAAAGAGEVDPDALVVCVLTGNGLKDPHTAESGLDVRMLEAEPTVGSVSRALGWW
jgi:threonine synthase